MNQTFIIFFSNAPNKQSIRNKRRKIFQIVCVMNLWIIYVSNKKEKKKKRQWRCVKFPIWASSSIHAQSWSTSSSTNVTLCSTCSWSFLPRHTSCIWQPSSSSSTLHHWTRGEKQASSEDWNLCTTRFEHLNFRRPPSPFLFGNPSYLLLIYPLTFFLCLSLYGFRRERRERRIRGLASTSLQIKLQAL